MEPATLYNARESCQEENPRILHNGVTPLISRNSSVVVSLSAWQWRFAMVWHRTGCSLGPVDRPHLGPNSCRDMGGHQDVLLHGQLLHISNTHWNACRILGQRLWTRVIRKNIRTLFVGYPYRLPESNDHQNPIPKSNDILIYPRNSSVRRGRQWNLRHPEIHPE